LPFFIPEIDDLLRLDPGPNVVSEFQGDGRSLRTLDIRRGLRWKEPSGTSDSNAIVPFSSGFLQAKARGWSNLACWI
jgi:hypothetical protein